MKQKIKELLTEGRTYSQIAEQLGCAKSTVSYHSKNAGLRSQHFLARTNEEVISKAKELYASGLSASKVAVELGVCKATIMKYVETRPTVGMSKTKLRENRVVQVIAWRARTKEKLVAYKGGKCEICGYNKCLQALEFHHRDPSVKEFGLGGKSNSFDRLKDEADKCVLVCANCHREIHAGLITILIIENNG